jgi:flagellar basal body-associated protein FliL
MAKAEVKPVKKPASGSDGMDKYALHVAIFTVVLLVASLGLYFFTHSKTKIEKKENYLALPQLVYSSASETVRMQIALQVNDKDQEWLNKNKAAINEIYKITIQEIDPSTFRSNDGRVAVQEKLKEEINSKMKVNKIEAVLYNDLLVQVKEEE